MTGKKNLALFTIKKLGGGMGVVSEGEDLKLYRHVALN